MNTYDNSENFIKTVEDVMAGLPDFDPERFDATAQWMHQRLFPTVLGAGPKGFHAHTGAALPPGEGLLLVVVHDDTWLPPNLRDAGRYQAAVSGINHASLKKALAEENPFADFEITGGGMDFNLAQHPPSSTVGVLAQQSFRPDVNMEFATALAGKVAHDYLKSIPALAQRWDDFMESGSVTPCLLVILVADTSRVPVGVLPYEPRADRELSEFVHGDQVTH